MRKLLLLLSLLLAVSTMDAQEKKFYYADVWIIPNTSLTNPFFTATVDVGTNEQKCFRMLFHADKTNSFYSKMGVINEMSNGGWKVVAHYIEDIFGVGVYHDHFIMEKEASSLEEAIAAPSLIGGEELEKVLKELKAKKKEQKKEKAKERAKKRTDDMYY